MMEMVRNNSDYIRFAQQGVQIDFSSALRCLATPPRQNINCNKRKDSQYKFCTPPSTKAPENTIKAFSKESVTRNSPSRLSPSQLHDFYAGAKFGERPSPTELPKPPNHWMNGNINLERAEESCIEMTNSLKVLLKVQS